MVEHPRFPDLKLHSDEGLRTALGANVVARETIHAWPLSCVQKVLLDDGRLLAYKSQLPPTVEPAFYAAASSRLLPGCQQLGMLDRCATMALDWIDAPRLIDTVVDVADLLTHGRRLVAEIGEIAGDLPTYLDLAGVEAWTSVAETTLDKLDTLIGDGRFQFVTAEQSHRLRAFATTSAVLDAVSSAPRVTHGDLTAQQVFLTDDGYRVIDWQRPVVAPADIDLVALLVDRDVDPRPFVAAPVIGVFWFLYLRWAVVAQHDLFPDGRWQLFDYWAARSVEHILAPS
ncbi:MAG: hypothetical protein IRY85_14745 [Micromonosporaceae bacterium]|nr:hypothetical protein [Micromonosporaceae bacterium]